MNDIFKNGLNSTLSILILGVWFWLGACSGNSPPSSHPPSDNLEVTMNPSQTEAMRVAAVPPIDAAASENFETATFGLG